MFRENDIIFLLGAGCSKDAGLPTSIDMVKKLDDLVETNGDWNKYRDLHYFIKGAIRYSKGIKGETDDRVNIEEIVNALSELEKKEHSILYPFIGCWTPRLQEVAGSKFNLLKSYKKDIVKSVGKWVCLSNHQTASYYGNFFTFQRKYTYFLRIFTLNYDLCLEENIPQRMGFTKEDLERGFDEDRIWDWRRFEPRDDVQLIYYYKMHGSIDWERDPQRGNVLTFTDQRPTDNPDMIFGTNYKLQYTDPYLFYAYEFRKYSLECKIIVIIGYSFGDAHINGIITQALHNDAERKILVVSPHANVNRVQKQLNLNNDQQQVVIKKETAREFLSPTLSIKKKKKVIKSP